MTVPYYLVLPLLASLMYAFGSLYFKEAFQHGVNLIHAFVVTNWIMALVFVPLILVDAKAHDWATYLQPLFCALLFFGGHWFNFMALRRGDMSIVVPAMGTKSFFVALGATGLFGKAIAPGMWAAAVLTAVGIYILKRSDIGKLKRQSSAIGPAILSAACFGICDSAVESWAPAYGPWQFIGLVFLIVALASSTLLPLADRPLRLADRTGMKALTIGGGILALQGILVAISVVSFDNATGVNIVYSARGLWSVVLVWWLGHRFLFRENERGRNTLMFRLIGAGIMMIAVFLATWESATI